MNEADVREDILAPLLFSLGYRKGTAYNICREVPLRYPRQSLGRKQEARDPVLRGCADYILSVNEEFNWILEAKSPFSKIRIDEIEQAWTYAVHPEVRAAYFVLCNGLEFRVFDSFASPTAREILSIQYHELGSRFSELLHLLSPNAIERQIALRASKRGTPLGPFLDSTAQVANGLIRYFESGKPGIVNANWQTNVVGGTVQRDDSGCIVICLKTQAPLPGMQSINEQVGFYGFDLRSGEALLPTDFNNPLEFSGAMMFTIPSGYDFPLAAIGETLNLAYDLECQITIVGSGILENRCFSGFWSGKMDVWPISIPRIPISGDFSIRLM